MKYAYLGGLLYGRPHLITQEALDGLHQGFQSILRRGGADLGEVIEEIGSLAGKFTGLAGLQMATDGPSRGRDPTGFMSIGNVALVNLTGVIGRNLGMMRICSGGCDLNRVDRALKGAAANGEIDHVVMICDSPGGSALGTPETAALFRAVGTQKKTYAFTNGECCSAAYYIASQAGQVYCSQSSWLGSIGVRAIFLDKTMQLATEGVKVNAISSGKWKCAGASWKEMSPEERAMFQATSDTIASQFKAAVTSSRPQIAADSMEGQCFMGAQAIEAGLADGVIDDLDELVSSLLLQEDEAAPGDTV